MKNVAQYACALGLIGLLVSSSPSGAAGIAPPFGGAGAISPPSALHHPEAGRYGRFRPDTCSGKGVDSFVGGSGGTGGLNIAGGNYSGVLSGTKNFACGEFSSVSAGFSNETDENSDFIGGGSTNIAGGLATVNQPSNAVVAGTNNDNEGLYSVIGAGGQNKIAASCHEGTSGCQSPYGGTDSAIVAGKSNIVNGGTGNTANDSIIGAGASNTLTGQWAAIVAGGSNQEYGDYGFVGGGSKNVLAATAQYGSLGGGTSNQVNATAASVGGGNANIAGGSYAAIAGGSSNSASGLRASVLGGGKNQATGQDSAVPGGNSNLAQGVGSLAAGRGAVAANDGSFVWSDQATKPPLTTTAVDQFVVRASGGVYFYSSLKLTTGVNLAPGSGSWSTLSDRAVKTAFAPLDDDAVLAKVAALPVSEWSYTAQGTGIRHVGPMAQDFRSAFRLGEDDRHISIVDENGVALAAIKALKRNNDALLSEVRSESADIAVLKTDLARIASRLRTLEQKR